MNLRPPMMLLALGAYVSCASEPNATTGPDPSFVRVSRAASASSAAASTSSAQRATAPAAERAEACASAVESLAPDASPELAMRVVVEGCLLVYREPLCRQGMQQAIAPETHPSERVTIMSRACADAYCPRLAEPKPAFCSAPRDMPPSERQALYGPFRDAMLELELGPEGKLRVLAAFEAAAQRRRAAAPP